MKRKMERKGYNRMKNEGLLLTIAYGAEVILMRIWKAFRKWIMGSGKDWSDCETEFQYENCGSDYRCYWYRAMPSEIPLLDRIFHNPWIQLHHHHNWGTNKSDLYDWIFSIKEYKTMIKPLNTVGDAEWFLKKEQSAIDAAWEKLVREDRVWPDND